MRRMSFGQATVDATRLAMRADERVIVLGEDISWGGNFGQFRGLLEEFGPDRIIDMPISEALIMSAAVGAAMCGLRPVASMSFLEFTLGAMDEIVNQAAKMRYMSGGQVSVPLVLRASDGVLRSSAAQHSGSLEALFHARRRPEGGGTVQSGRRQGSAAFGHGRRRPRDLPREQVDHRQTGAGARR